MNIRDGIYMRANMRWQTVDFPLLCGTPVSAHGTVANDGSAVGIVPQTISKMTEPMDDIYILVSGTVEMDGVEYGSLSDDAKAALCRIAFMDKAGKAWKPEKPIATETTYGMVKKAANVAEAAGSAPTAAEFKSLLDALIAAGMMAEGDA